MGIREHVSLAELTTLRVGGLARYVLECSSRADVEEAIQFCNERGLSFAVLGGGSNVLASDNGYTGALLHMQIQGISYREEGGLVHVSAGAGVAWEAVVNDVVERGLWGLENLAGIPGTVGAAPVQNIGAYGVELQSVFESATVYDAHTHTWSVLDKEACAFAYRDSVFKHSRTRIIAEVTLVLKKRGSPCLGYSDLRALSHAGVVMDTPVSIVEAIRDIRSHKFPDLAQVGTAGSFFKNPIVTPEAFLVLCQRFGSLPSFPVKNGVKIPLAYILDHILHLRGYVRGNISLYGNQPLVLVAERGATAHDIDVFADDIADRVHRATGMSIEREVQRI